LGGNLPTSYKRLRKETQDFLQDLRSAAPNESLSYEFISPADWSQEQKEQAHTEMAKFGLGPLPILENHADGSRTQRLLYPTVSLNFDGKIQYFSLFENSDQESPEDIVNRSIANLSYQFTSKISRMVDGKAKIVGFTEGQGELDDREL